MDDAEKEFEILGAARALGARGSVSGSGVSLGLDRGSDETRSGFRKAAVLVRAHWPGGAGGGCGGRTGDARGCLPQGGGLGTRKPESVGPWHTPDPLDCGRRADVCQARGATRKSIQRAGSRSTKVRTRSPWRDLEIRGFSSGIAGRMCKDSEHATRFCSAECLCDGADGGTNGKGRRRTACTPQNDARRIPDSRQRRRVGDPRCGRAKNFRLRFRQGAVGEMIRNATLGPPCQKRAPAEGFNSSKASVLGERKPASRATEASSPRASSSSAILS